MSLLQASRLSPAKLVIAKMACRSMGSNVYIGADGMKKVKIDPKLKRWKDITDECVVTYSTKVLDNPMYQHPQSIKSKKMQFWGKIEDGHPIWHKFGFTPNFNYSHRKLHVTPVRCDVKIVTVPQLAESLSEGDIRWEKGVGDSVKTDEVIGEIETDKTSVPINAPCSGVIEELLVEDGTTVQPGKEVCKIRMSAGGETAQKPASKPTETSQTIASPPPSSTPPSQKTTPPPVPPKPTGPISSTPISSIKPFQVSPLTPQATGKSESRVKINRMRQRIAQRLKDAQNTYAMLTTFNEIDMSNIIDMRNHHKDAFLKKHNLKLGFMSAFVKATAYALQDQPVVNAVIDDNEIIYRDYIDISVAVATPKGLVVPVIRGCENMNYAQIEKAISDLGEKARNNALAIEDMDGGTFTISNGGVFGSMFGTPIINPPQSAILGMHAIIERPVVINGNIEARPMMYVALTYDHRLIDGREGVLFLRKIKAAVEDPRIILLDV